MKSADIVRALAAGIVKYSDKFSTNLTLTSLTSVGNTVTAISPVDHNLNVGDSFAIVNAITPIEVSSFTRSGTEGVIVTAVDHDATIGVPENINVEGATEPEFNGSFKITEVLNRQTIVVEMVDSGPLTATGSPAATNIANVCGSYNGTFEVSAVNSTTEFEYLTELNIPSSAAIGGPELRRNVRVVSNTAIERIIDVYTKDPPNNYWLYVVLDDTQANKSRDIQSDAVDNIQIPQYFRQQIIQGCTIYLLIPTRDQLAGDIARDEAEEVFGPICRSILFKQYDSYLSQNKKGSLQFVTHGIVNYNTAYYMHGYSFTQVVDLLFDDTVGYDDDVAFRDISLSQTATIGTGEINTEIDLDEEPLP